MFCKQGVRVTVSVTEGEDKKKQIGKRNSDVCKGHTRDVPRQQAVVLECPASNPKVKCGVRYFASNQLIQ